MNDDVQKEEESFEDVTFVESTEDGDALPTKDVVRKLREDLKKARTEKEEYLTGWQRSKADYVNLQKDEEAKRKNLKNHTTIGLVEDMLPALDSFDMAFANKEAWEKVDANWRAGVEYIQKQFIQALEGYGVSKISHVGVLFDPTLHESIESIETSDKNNNHRIASVTQSGYKIGEIVIRPARVKVYEYKE
jgi:molecular chaperone GrpE